MLAPKNKDDYVIAASGRCAVPASELPKHTLDRLKELWAVVRPSEDGQCIAGELEEDRCG